MEQKKLTVNHAYKTLAIIDNLSHMCKDGFNMLKALEALGYSNFLDNSNKYELMTLNQAENLYFIPVYKYRGALGDTLTIVFNRNFEKPSDKEWSTALKHLTK